MPCPGSDYGLYQTAHEYLSITMKRLPKRKDVVEMETKPKCLTDNAAADRILIVDDDPVNRKILGKLFSTFYTVIEAEDGQAGMEQILRADNRLCAILLDVMMPKMNGIEVLRRLKDLELLPLENVLLTDCLPLPLCVSSFLSIWRV